MFFTRVGADSQIRTGGYPSTCRFLASHLVRYKHDALERYTMSREVCSYNCSLDGDHSASEPDITGIGVRISTHVTQ